MDYPIYLTLEEAQDLVPVIEKKMAKLLKLNKVISLIKTVNIETEKPNIEAEVSLMELNKNYFNNMHSFYKELIEITKLGGVVKDIDKGLVDFFSKHESRDILLCWKYGEAEIKFWHEVDSGFANRKSVDLLEKNKNRINSDIDNN